jgi:hypothetical protein
VLAHAGFGTSNYGAFGASTNPSRWIREPAHASLSYADSPRFIGWRSLDRRCPTSNALCRYARTARATPNRTNSSGAAQAIAKATQHQSVDGRPQGRSRALGLEVNELLPRAFRRLAEILGKPGSKVCPRAVKPEKPRAPVSPSSHRGGSSKLPRSRFQAEPSLRPEERSDGQDASHKRRAIHIFKDRHPTFAEASGLIRVSSNRPMGVCFHDTRPLRPANPTAPFGVFFRVRCDQRMTSGSSSPAAPRDALRFGENRAGRPA